MLPRISLGLAEEIHYPGSYPIYNQNQYLSLEYRRQHILLLGKPGSGKSTYMLNFIDQELKSGRALILIDPHGDLAQRVLDQIPSIRTSQTIVIDLGDPDWSVGWNPLANIPKHRIQAEADEIMGAFKSAWQDISWGPRLEDILRATLIALIEAYEAENTTLAGIVQMLLSPAYRKRIVRHITNAFSRQYWEVEFEGILKNEQKRMEIVEAVLNKVRPLFQNDAICNFLAQPRPKFDLRYCMNNNHIVIFKLPIGSLGQTYTSLLGSLILSQIKSAGFARQDILPHDRKDVAVFVDEWHNFTTPATVESLLAECRKFGISIIAAHQHLAQLDHQVQKTVLANFGSFVLFTLGPTDAELFAPLLDCPAHWLTQLPNHKARAKFKQHSREFPRHLLLATPEEPQPRGSTEKVIRTSRLSYAKPAADVQARVVNFIATYHPRYRPTGSNAAPKPKPAAVATILKDIDLATDFDGF